MFRVLRSSSFWIPFLISLVITGTFFAWELGFFLHIVPSFPRPGALPWELTFTGLLGFLMSLNAGLAVWQSRYGHCPIGVKRASGVAVLLGAFTLICPVCVLLPASLIGIGFFFAFLGPFLPLLRVISVVLLITATWMLWPKRD
jgi:hypothetical protein